MKRLALSLAVLAMSGAAFAESTTIKRTETPFGDSTTVKKESWDGSTTTKKTIDSTGSLGGCDTKSVTKTDDDGDTTTKTRTDC
jgi:hypothetical protein